MTHSDWQLAETVARELVNRETDISEFQKAITYARVQTSVPEGKVGEKFFALLDTMVRDGRYLVRSGRTLDYYRDLQAVCRQHLSGYRAATGKEGKKLVEILGWAARLMRYYNTEAGDAELTARQRAAERGQQRSQPTSPPTQSAPAQAPPRAPIKQQASAAPPRSETKREKVTLITAVKNGKAQVRTAQGEELTCANLPAYPPSKAGDVCSADVMREGGKAAKAIFKGWA
jgi:hypothetical protein